MIRYILAFIMITSAAFAAPHAYRLDQNASLVEFTFDQAGHPQKGRMPVSKADILLDLQNIKTAKVYVELGANSARAGSVFATQAMKDRSVLDTKKHPKLIFKSTSVRGTIHNAKLTGELTLRGVTRRITLDAQLFRQKDTQAGDLDKLSILLTGAVNRHDFGASGYPKLVGDTIALKILARIEK